MLAADHWVLCRFPLVSVPFHLIYPFLPQSLSLGNLCRLTPSFLVLLQPATTQVFTMVQLMQPWSTTITLSLGNLCRLTPSFLVLLHPATTEVFTVVLLMQPWSTTISQPTCYVINKPRPLLKARASVCVCFLAARNSGNTWLMGVKFRVQCLLVIIYLKMSQTQKNENYHNYSLMRRWLLYLYNKKKL